MPLQEFIPPPGEAENAIFRLPRAPSQKELAALFRITPRHLRRWEEGEAKDGRPCGCPYTVADLWRLACDRGTKNLDPLQLARLGLAPLFEKFALQLGQLPSGPAPTDSEFVVFHLLQALARDENDSDALPLPRMIEMNLASAARDQLRTILCCKKAGPILIRAFFEASLVAETTFAPLNRSA